VNRTEINDLRQKRAAIAAQASAILDAAGNNPLTPEQRTSWDAHMADVDSMKARIEAEERRLTLDAEMNSSIREAHRPEVRNGSEQATRIVDTPEYGDAFRSYLRYGFNDMPAAQRSIITQGYEQRAQSVGTTTAGGYTVPQGFMTSLEVAMKAYGNVEGVASVLSTDSGNDIPWPTINDTTQTGELVAENASASSQDMTFSSITMKSYYYSSKIILVSWELLNDSAFSIEGLVADIAGERLGRIKNTHFTTGDNSGKPQGVVTFATSGKTAASATAITYTELIDLEHSIDPAIRVNCRYMFNDVVLQALRKLQDSTGRPLWQAGITAGAPDTINGRPYTINQDMAVMTTGNKTVLFGDFARGYKVRKVKDVQVFRVTDKYIESRQVGFIAYTRCDGRGLSAGTQPIKYLVQA
jgi:HK97 family phage major capsid protein